MIDMTIRPTLRAYPITILFMAFWSITVYVSEVSSAKFFIPMFVIFPLALLLWLQVRGTTYRIKNGVLIRRQLIGRSAQYLKLADVKRMDVKNVFLDTGHLTLHTVAGRVTLKNIPNVQALADKVSGKEKDEWVLRPVLRAFLLEISLLLTISYTVYANGDGVAQLIYSLLILFPALVMLLITIKGRKYALKKGIVSAKRFLQATQIIDTEDVVDITIKRVGIGAGHMTLHGADGKKMDIKNIQISHKDVEKIFTQ
ncbi:MAG: hypothetical protein RPT25_02725 [Cycloclasticus sp.]